MISRIALHWRWLRRLVSRNLWAACLLGVRHPPGESAEPGLILIQFDGLSRTQFEKAVSAGRLPFLAKLIKRKHFALETFYSGVPSTTPAVQGEIFFGVKASVPSFQFFRRGAARDFRMFEAASALEIEEELLRACPEPLLQGGHGYSNIYRAGAARSYYCSRDFAPEEIWRRLHFLRWLLLGIVYLPKIIRMAALAVLEFALALIDAVGGLFARENLFKELAFVPARIAICVVLREAIRFRVLLDIERGVRVIHANFLGYDEQAHRRGPSSAFAHWSLKALDRTVRDIYRAANDSRYRDYEVMVYSDHGQEHTTPYRVKHGRELEEALREVFSHSPLAGHAIWMRKNSDLIGGTVESCRAFFGIRRKAVSKITPDPETQIIVTAMGPLGHLYFPEILAEADMEALAQELVSRARIPLVLRRRAGGEVSAYNRRGAWTLPADRAEILGADHPFLDEATADLVHLAGQADAGDLIVSGWDPQQPPLTFVPENGAHGGPGSEETRGFFLVPDRIRHWHLDHLAHTRERVRGEDLRLIAMHYLGRDGGRIERIAPRPQRVAAAVRVMTYNVHSCQGIDSKTRPERIARVINHFDPDIVAVQEIDCHRPRSGGHDQAQLIADHLGMSHVFQAMFEEEKERYGIAIFSNHPMEIIKAANLTEADPKRFREARGAIWVKVSPDDGMTPYHFINTHFGLGRVERQRQMQTLAGPEWLGAIPPTEPVILCGDFNTGPKSPIFHQLQRLRDVQAGITGFKPRPTFSSMNPFLRLDHIFVSPHFVVNAIEVPGTPTAALASDHLPVGADLTLS